MAGLVDTAPLPFAPWRQAALPLTKPLLLRQSRLPAALAYQLTPILLVTEWQGAKPYLPMCRWPRQYAASNTSSPSTLTSTEFFNEQLHLYPQSSTTAPDPTRPALYHWHSAVPASAASSVLEKRSRRLRSGLSTLPSTGLSNPFGSSIDVPTLGLDDEIYRRPPAATVSKLHNQKRAAIASNLSNLLLRATTVSQFYRQLSRANSLRGTSNPEDEEEVYEPSYGRPVASSKTENATQIQTPTRSLWIGNLDSSVTSEQLIHVFAPYGEIESLRLLPEKVRYRCKTEWPYNRFLIKFRNAVS